MQLLKLQWYIEQEMIGFGQEESPAKTLGDRLSYLVLTSPARLDRDCGLFRVIPRSGVAVQPSQQPLATMVREMEDL